MGKRKRSMIPTVGAGLAPAPIDAPAQTRGRIRVDDVALAQIRVWLNHTPTRDCHCHKSPVWAGLAPAPIDAPAQTRGHIRVDDVALAQIRVWVNHTPTRDCHWHKSPVWITITHNR